MNKLLETRYKAAFPTPRQTYPAGWKPGSIVTFMSCAGHEDIGEVIDKAAGTGANFWVMTDTPSNTIVKVKVVKGRAEEHRSDWSYR